MTPQYGAALIASRAFKRGPRWQTIYDAALTHLKAAHLAGFHDARDAAALLADSYADHFDPAKTPYEDGYQNAAMGITEAIRALEPKP